MLRDDVHAYEKIDGSNISENLPETIFRYFRVLSALLPSLSEKNHRDASKLAKDDLLRILEPKFVGMETLFHNFKEEISPSTAISWYTQETPIYRLVNQAFDYADPNLLMALRYFIGCLSLQVKQEHQESKKMPRRFKNLDQKSGVFHVYRGQLLSNSDLERLKTLVGSVIFLTSFTLTTQERNVALGFLRRGFRSDRETFVLFKIAIDHRVEEIPVYADVAHLSYNADQEEVLLMFGAALLVKEIKDDPYNGFPTVEFALHPNPQLNEAMNMNHKKSQTESRVRRAVSKVREHFRHSRSLTRSRSLFSLHNRNRELKLFSTPLTENIDDDAENLLILGTTSRSKVFCRNKILFGWKTGHHPAVFMCSKFSKSRDR